MDELIHTMNMLFFLFTFMSLVYGKILHIWKDHRVIEYVIATFCVIGGIFALESGQIIPMSIAITIADIMAIFLIMYLFIIALHDREKKERGCSHKHDSLRLG